MSPAAVGSRVLTRRFLISLLVLAVGVRVCVGAVLLTEGSPAFVLASDDGDAYDALARLQAFDAPVVMTERMASKWDAGPAYVADRWPRGYWLFLAAQYSVFGSAYASTIVLQALLGGIGALAVYALASLALSSEWARLAAVAQALSSTSVYLSASLFAESVYVPLLLAGLALIAWSTTGRLRPSFTLASGVLAGVLFGLAEVTRPVALPIFVVALAWTVRMSRWRVPLALSGGFLVALAPFAVYDLATLGRITLFTAGGANAVHDQAAHGTGLMERTFVLFLGGGWAPLGEPMISALGSAAAGATRLVEWLLAAIGLVVLVRRQQVAPVAWLVAAAAVAVVLPALLVGLPLVRYRAPADPLFIIWMACAIQALSTWQVPFRALRAPALPASVCVGIAALSALPAGYDLWTVINIAVNQLRAGAAGSDFLNLYAGAALHLHQPPATYQLDAQLNLQRALTERDNLLVPFYLPPYAALAVSWLGWLPYGVAYLVWLIGGVACVVLAAYWIAPRWTRWYPLVWLGLALLFLPVVLGLAQGQASALMLVCFAAIVRAMLDRKRSLLPGIGLLGWTLKPQFAPFFVCALVSARRWRTLAVGAGVVGTLAAVAVLRIGLPGIAEYLDISRYKLQEALGGDPVFLIGPTLVHASRWYMGASGVAMVIAGALVAAAVAAFVYVWRSGPASDDALLLQLAMLPVVSIVAAPYALIFELTAWLGTFWLLWRYTARRPEARVVLLWLAAGVWIAADVGVGDARAGGADIAALLGLVLLGFIAWLYHTHEQEEVDPIVQPARQSEAHVPIA